MKNKKSLAKGLALSVLLFGEATYLGYTFYKEHEEAAHQKAAEKYYALAKDNPTAEGESGEPAIVTAERYAHNLEYSRLIRKEHFRIAAAAYFRLAQKPSPKDDLNKSLHYLTEATVDMDFIDTDFIGGLQATGVSEQEFRQVERELNKKFVRILFERAKGPAYYNDKTGDDNASEVTGARNVIQKAGGFEAAGISETEFNAVAAKAYFDHLQSLTKDGIFSYFDLLYALEYMDKVGGSESVGIGQKEYKSALIAAYTIRAQEKFKAAKEDHLRGYANENAINETILWADTADGFDKVGLNEKEFVDLFRTELIALVHKELKKFVEIDEVRKAGKLEYLEYIERRIYLLGGLSTANLSPEDWSSATGQPYNPIKKHALSLPMHESLK